MITLYEKTPLPMRCVNCKEVKEFGVDAVCYSCDYALDRFEIIQQKEAEHND